MLHIVIEAQKNRVPFHPSHPVTQQEKSAQAAELSQYMADNPKWAKEEAMRTRRAARVSVQPWRHGTVLPSGLPSGVIHGVLENAP